MVFFAENLPLQLTMSLAVSITSIRLVHHNGAPRYHFCHQHSGCAQQFLNAAECGCVNFCVAYVVEGLWPNFQYVRL